MAQNDHPDRAPEIDPDSDLFPFEQIAEWLEQRILTGDLSPGQAMPSETTLGQAFPTVARTTIRRSFRLLRTKGLIYTKPRRGSFVTRPEDRPEPEPEEPPVPEEQLE